jgi:hypothetical protein
VTGCVRADIIAAFGGLALEALHVRAADAAGLQPDQDLVWPEFGKLDFFYPQIFRAI